MNDPPKSADAELEEAWTRGEPIELKRTRPPTSVLSIRVPTEVLRKLTERARAEGRSPSSLGRELIEAGLLSQGPSTPAELAKTFARWVEETIEAGLLPRLGGEGPDR